jgi:hypothetical protein
LQVEKEAPIGNCSKPASNSALEFVNTKRALDEGPLFSFSASLGEQIKLQPVRSRLAPQERCAQLSCASKPGGFMRPSGAQGAHGFLVRPGNAWRKRKEQEKTKPWVSRASSAD